MKHTGQTNTGPINFVFAATIGTSFTSQNMAINKKNVKIQMAMQILRSVELACDVLQVTFRVFMIVNAVIVYLVKREMLSNQKIL